MDRIDIAIIGAGVVGLAIARALTLQGRDLIILEQESHFGAHTSSRNSEVIHAGLYYPTGSLKARYCVEGSRRLYEYCDAHHIDYRRCGKLVVGKGAAQATAIEKIAALGIANGAEGLSVIDGAAVRNLEPELNVEIGLLSANTGIVDSHGYMLSLLGDNRIAYNSKVTRLAMQDGGVALWLNGEDRPSLWTRLLINSAGLWAPELARRLEGFPAEKVPRSWLARGNYFTHTGRAPFRHLIYPGPQEGGLGIHLTLDLAGQARFGPDVEWIDQVDYRLDPNRAAAFYEAIRLYWPALKDGSLSPSYSGIRPKIVGPGMPAADFLIEHSVEGVIHLFGIESPGLTASLPIADHVARIAAAY